MGLTALMLLRQRKRGVPLDPSDLRSPLATVDGPPGLGDCSLILPPLAPAVPPKKPYESAGD